MKEDEIENRAIDKILGKLKHDDEFQVPKDYFDSLSKSMEERIYADDADESFFIQQQEQILFKSKFSVNDSLNEFSVPVDYFDKTADKIAESVGVEKEARVFSIRQAAIGLLTAASIAAVVVYFLPSSAEDEKSSFEIMLAETSIEETDFLNLLSNEELNQLYLMEIEQNDYDINEVAEVISMEQDIVIEEKNEQQIKPFSNADALIFEDIADEDIIEYLMEEDSDELYNY